MSKCIICGREIDKHPYVEIGIQVHYMSRKEAIERAEKNKDLLKFLTLNEIADMFERSNYYTFTAHIDCFKKLVKEHIPDMYKELTETFT